MIRNGGALGEVRILAPRSVRLMTTNQIGTLHWTKGLGFGFGFETTDRFGASSMALPAMLYVTFIPRGSDIRGLGISAALASGISAEAGPLLGGVIAFLGAWILFKTQLDLLEGMVRAITDILWTGSGRVRGWRGGDVRAVYYTVLAVVVVWGVIALRIAQPIVLLQLAANVGGFVFVVASLHLLYINTRLLPLELRPPLWRRAALVAMCLFYGFFVSLSLWSVWG